VRSQVSVLLEELFHVCESQKVLCVFTGVERIDETVQRFQGRVIWKNLENFRGIDDLGFRITFLREVYLGFEIDSGQGDGSCEGGVHDYVFEFHEFGGSKC
jgi:hypothetical protein